MGSCPWIPLLPVLTNGIPEWMKNANKSYFSSWACVLHLLAIIANSCLRGEDTLEEGSSENANPPANVRHERKKHVGHSALTRVPDLPRWPLCHLDTRHEWQGRYVAKVAPRPSTVGVAQYPVAFSACDIQPPATMIASDESNRKSSAVETYWPSGRLPSTSLLLCLLGFQNPRLAGDEPSNSICSSLPPVLIKLLRLS